MSIKSIKKSMLNLTRKCVKYGVRFLYYIGTYIFSPEDNIILFESSNGRNYTGNPRFIYEELINQGLDKEYECIWAFTNPQNHMIPGTHKKVKKSRFKFLYYTIKSGTWVLDSRHLYYLKKNKNTRYIQTWHGTPLKKLGLDMDYVNMSGNQDIERYHEDFKKNSADWQYLISQNSYSSEIFRRAFAFNGRCLK